jgi:lysophospholipase L1-like esterase
MNNRWSLIRSILCFLIFLELFFWIGSWITQGTQFLENIRLSGTKDVYKIMCIGESTTYLGGKDSYPSQLERFLNTHGQGKRFVVINQGMAGATSTSILSHLDQWLTNYKPDMVIAMVGINDSDDTRQLLPLKPMNRWLMKSKVYQLVLHLKSNVCQAIESYIQDKRRYMMPAPKEKKNFDSEYEMFQDALGKQSYDQKRLYALIQLSRGLGHDDIAKSLYEKFLQDNSDPLIRHWVIKEYGVYLGRIGRYDDFLSIMHEVPYDAWQPEFIRGYCHGEQHMENLRYIIENMVEHKWQDKAVYGYLASCYDEGGRGDLADFYLNKIRIQDSYSFKTTIENYLAIKDMLLSRDIRPVFVQYPMRNIESLRSIFTDVPGHERIIFVDNGPSFHEAVRKDSYEKYFYDRAAGDIGHATPQGNYLLAANIAKEILDEIKR